MKKYKQLTSEQRYAIYLEMKNGAFQREIAKKIGVSPSTVSREVRRNKNKFGGYSWRLAQEMANERKEHLPGNRATPEWIKQKVFRQVRQDWSPKQISGYFKRYESIDISHETIYKWIRKDKNEGGDLYKHCRHRLKYRQRPVGSVKNIPNRVSIRQRPAEADGTRFGDFEMDTIIGATHSEAILTLTERKTNYLLIRKLPKGKDSGGVVKEVFKALLPFKDILKTITTDNGSEFAAHREITKKLEVPIYFTDPYSSWQKGAIENANKLIRQYIPKKASFKDYSDDDIKQIQYKLNHRPREKLNFNSPKNVFYKNCM
ncbi:IS30 family transposase [Proteiniphilum propionicum]|uniref:IS30 family transposase n=1 Tax=Proteiniphilum propionicum TaxID=2829812 RepID=UPI001EEBE4F6|nr:IS30 family transposase [Proteiniphilum propionicum]ULB35049.1 IS30 family transposase [Proteiniphilum propionicum]